MVTTPIGALVGVLFVLPIGGANMPVVVSLLNSYAGLAAVATGFALDNTILIVVGALDGLSGFILSMAVSQAQHQIRELGELIEKRGGEVRYAIHPVAGRMPGHINVLLAEAGVPYDKLIDMEEINERFADTDISVVVGANDVVNPAARINAASPIYGMPILKVADSKAVLVLFVDAKTSMLFGDARASLAELGSEVKIA